MTTCQECQRLYAALKAVANKYPALKPDRVYTAEQITAWTQRNPTAWAEYTQAAADYKAHFDGHKVVAK
jgi:hypothetical protein